MVALSTAVLLLLCQTAALAQSCLMAPATQGKTSAASMPCHTASEGDTSHQPSTASMCDASIALAEIAKAGVFPLADIPVLVIATHDFVPRLYIGIPRASQAVCSSPPLSVLHCRFLI
jgi:hypothetical protein